MLRICSVVVIFEPDLATLTGTLEAVVHQVDATVVIDNGSSEEVAAWLTAQNAAGTIVYRKLDSNLGLAKGHNAGIEWARQNGFSHVLLLDQDSCPFAGMVESLAATMLSLEADGRRVGAVGPRPVGENTARPELPVVKLGWLRSQRSWTDEATSGPIKADMVISSGSLIPLSVIDEIGAMDESLFIDNVDLEWCFRATFNGYELFGDANARMHHTIGESVFRVWFFRWRYIIVHSPVRLYYIMRNRVMLYSRPHTPLIWVAKDWYRISVKLFLFSVLIAPRRENTRMMLRGLLDGVRGIKGPYN